MGGCVFIDTANAKQKRIRWIDIAKGMGIIYVMFSHIQLLFIGRFILSFFIPLFFVLSGYTFSLRDGSDFNSFVKKIFKSIIIPYTSMMAILYLVYSCKLFATAQADITLSSLYMPVLGSIYSRYYLYDIHAYADNIKLMLMDNEALWFLTCLFMAEIVFYFIVRQNNKIKIYGMLTLCVLIGYVFDVYCKILMPWSIDTSFIFVLFLWTGYIIKEKNLVSNRLSKKQGILFGVFIVINMIFSELNSVPNTSVREYGNYVYFYIAALSGVGAQIIISKYIDEKIEFISKFLSYIGKNSLLILGFHLTFYKLITYISGILGINLTYFRFYGLIYVCLTLIILMPIINIINEKCPWILGKKRSISY